MRKLKGFIVSGEVVGEFCRNGRRAFTVSGPLPETAKFWSAHFDHSRNSFVCLFEDESFDSVPEGSTIPIVHGPVVTCSVFS